MLQLAAFPRCRLGRHGRCKRVDLPHLGLGIEAAFPCDASMWNTAGGLVCEQWMHGRAGLVAHVCSKASRRHGSDPFACGRHSPHNRVPRRSIPRARIQPRRHLMSLSRNGFQEGCCCYQIESSDAAHVEPILERWLPRLIDMNACMVHTSDARAYRALRAGGQWSAVTHRQRFLYCVILLLCYTTNTMTCERTYASPILSQSFSRPSSSAQGAHNPVIFLENVIVHVLFAVSLTPAPLSAMGTNKDMLEVCGC